METNPKLPNVVLFSSKTPQARLVQRALTRMNCSVEVVTTDIRREWAISFDGRVFGSPAYTVKEALKALRNSSRSL